MNLKTVILIITISSMTLLAACGGAAEPAKNNNSANNAAVNTPAQNSNNPLAHTTPTPVATTNEAPTLSPVFKAYCAAMEKKDEAAIRKIYSSDTLKSFEEVMKEDGITSLVEYLSTDKATTKLCEISNEEISGNNATAFVKTEGMPNGATVIFVKEGNDWKLTNRTPMTESTKTGAK